MKENNVVRKKSRLRSAKEMEALLIKVLKETLAVQHDEQFPPVRLCASGSDYPISARSGS
jgi:hypothetical protein